MKTALKRVMALVMAVLLIASVCVFTAMAAEEISVSTAAQLIDAITNHKGAQIKLTADIVLNEGVTFAYDEANALITVTGKTGDIASVATGEGGSTAGEEIAGSLSSLNKWNPLADLNGCTINGDGHKIVGLVIVPASKAPASFVATLKKDESIKNLTFENALVISNATTYTALAVGNSYGTVQNVKATGAVVFAYNMVNYHCVGGLIRTTTSTVDDTAKTELFCPVVDSCSFDGVVLGSGATNVTVGGVVAQCKGGRITNCANYGYVKSISGTTHSAGGVVGILEPTNGKAKAGDNGAPFNAYIENCANYGKVSSLTANRAGGVLGFADVSWSANEDVIIHNVYNAGDVVNGKGVIARTSTLGEGAKIKSASVTYAFTDSAKALETGACEAVFTVKSMAKGDTDKILSFLNDGATAYEGLKKWEKKDGVCVLTEDAAEYNDKFAPKDFVVQLKVLSAKVLNEREIELTFSEQANLVTPSSDIYIAVRYTNKDFQLQRDSGTNTPLQWAMTLRMNGSNKGIATYSAANTKSLADVLALKDYEDKGYYIYFCIEGKASSSLPTQQKGFVDHIQTKKKDMLVANRPNDNAINDGAYIAIEDAANATIPFTKATDLPPVEVEKPDLTPTEGGITIDSAKVIDESHIELTFSEAVKLTGNVYAAIRYTNNVLALQRSTDSKPLQFEGSLTFDGTKKVVFEYTGSTPLVDVINLKDYESKGYFVLFCIEGKPITAGASGEVGFIDNITSLDGSKMLSANKKDTVSNGNYDGYYVELEDTENATKEAAGPSLEPTEGGITILSAKAIDETHIEVTFSEPVVKVSNFFCAIRYTDKNLALQKDSSGSNLQWDAELKINGNKGTFEYKKNLYGILTKQGYEESGYRVYFCIEGLPDKNITDPQIGYVDNIQSKDRSNRLAANRSKPDGIYDDYFVVVEDVEKAKPENPPKLAPEDGPINITSAKILNSREIELTFDDEVYMLGNSYNCLRYTNDKYQVQKDNKDKYLQWNGTLTLNGSHKGIFTLVPDSERSMADIVSMKGYTDKGYKLYFCIEGLPGTDTEYVGYIDNLIGTTGDKMVKANKEDTNGIYDGIYVTVSDTQNATIKYKKPTPLPEGHIPNKPINPEVLKTPDNGVKVLSCEVVNSGQIKITFSEKVTSKGSVYAAIRYTDAKLALQRDDTKTPPQLQWGGTLSLDGSNVGYWSPNLGYDLNSVLKMTGYKNKGYYVFFCIEGLPNAAIKSPKKGYIDTIVGKSGKLLGANRPNDNAVYDGLFIQITKTENATKPFRLPMKNIPYVELLSVKAVNAAQLELTFSEPVVKQSNAYMAIRYTNDYKQVVREGDTVLQFAGNATFNGTEKVLWTCNQGVLYDILTMKDHENSGYHLYFCIEGMPGGVSQEIGYIDNITSEDGKKLLLCTPERANLNGNYDGLYVTIEDIEKAESNGESGTVEGIFVDEIKAIDDYSLQLTFSDNVYLVGAGTALSQYIPVVASVRFVNPKNYETIKANNTVMEFAADFSIDDGTNVGLFELRSKQYTIRDLFGKVGFDDVAALKDAIVVLALEGTEDYDTIILPLKGYVDNIQNEDGTKMLVAMKSAINGIDDCWIATLDDITFPKKEDGDAIAKYIDTENMTNKERETYNALTEEERKAKLDEVAALLEKVKVGELSADGKSAFDKVLKKNGVSAKDLKAYYIGTDGSIDLGGFPVTLKYDVSEMEFDVNDKIYVYRVNDDGTVTKLDRTTASVADGKIKNVKFMTDKVSDFVITNKDLDVASGSGILPWILGGAGVIVIAAAIIAIILGKKKKEKKN